MYEAAQEDSRNMRATLKDDEIVPYTVDTGDLAIAPPGMDPAALR
ncbi:hypothetical protein N7516_000829 [Penicillium verrucosum]|nr:uncharacterized protein N7516_000829 [Penicillium verrucosum]KAJ5940661.1 hypothetical protein N7516_000829 [Penicillium verrucosum]